MVSPIAEDQRYLARSILKFWPVSLNVRGTWGLNPLIAHSSKQGRELTQVKGGQTQQRPMRLEFFSSSS